MTATSPSAPRVFACPACGANLDAVDAPSVKCRYCNSTVPVPEALRPSQDPALAIQALTAESTRQWLQVAETMRGAALGITTEAQAGDTPGVVTVDMFAPGTTDTVNRAVKTAAATAAVGMGISAVVAVVMAIVFFVLIAGGLVLAFALMR